jgi:hypothetical protein
VVRISLLILLLLLCVHGSYAQSTYISVPPDSAAWRYRIYDEDFGITDFLLYSSTQDTVSGGHTYHKIYSRAHQGHGTVAYPPLVATDADLPDIYYGAFRDSAQKIYGLFLSGDKLLFDYQANVGDAVPAYGGTTTVTGIDSIAIGGVYHKRWSTSITGFTPIEGVGSSMGIIPVLVEPGGSTVFICYSHYDTSYIPDATVPCVPLYVVGTGLGVVTAANNDVNVYPSPVADVLHITVSLTEAFDGTIYNALGQLVWSGRVEKKQEVRTQSWPQGAYLLRLQGAGAVITQRIVK